MLREWTVKATLPPGFQEEVWRRIERREAQVPAWTALFSRLNAALARPSLAASYVTVLLLAGLLAGYWQVRTTKAHLDEALSSRYVQMVDPFQNPHR